MYFPVDKHRANWFENKDELIIAFPNAEDEWAPVTAYKLNGEKITLNAFDPPSAPVLAISPCEHHGVHVGTLNKLQQTTLPPDDGDGGGAGGGGGSGGGSSHGPRVNSNWEILHAMKLHDDGEAWILGDPEIYTVAASPQVGELSRDNFDNVNDEEVYYTLNHNLFHWYWNDYGNWYKLKVAEEDGFGVDVTVSYSGVSVTISITNDDDDLGEKIINKNDPYNEKYPTGDVDFGITYQE